MGEMFLFKCTQLTHNKKHPMRHIDFGMQSMVCYKKIVEGKGLPTVKRKLEKKLELLELSERWRLTGPD